MSEEQKNDPHEISKSSSPPRKLSREETIAIVKGGLQLAENARLFSEKMKEDQKILQKEAAENKQRKFDVARYKYYNNYLDFGSTNLKDGEMIAVQFTSSQLLLHGVKNFLVFSLPLITLSIGLPVLGFSLPILIPDTNSVFVVMRYVLCYTLPAVFYHVIMGLFKVRDLLLPGHNLALTYFCAHIYRRNVYLPNL